MTEMKRSRPNDVVEGLSNGDHVKKRKQSKGEDCDDKGLTSDEIMAVRRRHIG